MPKDLSFNLVQQWVTQADGTFTTRQIWSELNIVSPTGKSTLRIYLNRLVDTGIIAKTTLDGTFRKIDSEKKPMDWRNANPENMVPLAWPFQLEKYALIYPKNIVIVAGSKQEGKSTFLYNFIKLNMYHHQIDLYNTETGVEQMKDRFTDLDIPLDAPLEVYERYDNFADVIEPDHISVIDYLDLNSEFYLAGYEIDQIFRKLTIGIAVIGMQIPPPTTMIIKGVKKTIDRDYAYGGGSTAKRAFIYISMSSHKLKLKHAKKPAQKTIHPENMMWRYNFSEKGDFCDIDRYYGDNEYPL